MSQPAKGRTSTMSHEYDADETFLTDGWRPLPSVMFWCFGDGDDGVFAARMASSLPRIFHSSRTGSASIFPVCRANQA